MDSTPPLALNKTRQIRNQIDRRQGERNDTLQRSSRVFGGEPSRAVLRASTGLDLLRIQKLTN